MSVPSSTIYIISGVPLNQSYEHTLWFDSKLAQQTYFLNKATHIFANYTYLRPDNKIKIAGDVANARAWNYLMFQNDAGKWYYHFIDKVTYLNDSAVELQITLDVIQTFMFDWELKPCFIERTHTPTDEFGQHTLEEGLETGPLIQFDQVEIDLEDNVILIMMACDKDGNNAYGRMYGGVYSGLNVYAVDQDNIGNFNYWLNQNPTMVEAIVAMWMYPKALVSVENNEWPTGASVCLRPVTSVAKTFDVTVEERINEENMTGVVPVRNQKTLGYPYTMIYVSNNMGGCAVYHRERFNGTDYEFRIFGALSPDSGIQIVPKNYKRQGYNTFNFEEALSMPAFPSCAWASDTYKVWLAQNQNQLDLAQKQAVRQMTMGAVSSTIGLIGSVATANPLGIIGSFAGAVGSFSNSFGQIESLMAQKADMAIQPDQARGNHSGTINLTHGRMGFTIYFMKITPEYVARIDDYFTRYGYKVNQIAVPSIRNRELFTYVKTVGSLVTGNLGTEDQLKIQAIFDKGITFWTNPEKVGDYFSDNACL